MNEISILMHFLSKRSNTYQYGATEKEILNFLNVKNVNKTFYFQELITNLSNYLKPLGLQIQYNPLDSHWFISFKSEISDFVSANPFEGKPRLGATLFCVLACCLKYFGVSGIPDIQKLRNKKSIIEDLKELEKMGFIEILQELNQVKMTSLIGYKLDLEKLFIHLSLSMNEK